MFRIYIYFMTKMLYLTLHKFINLQNYVLLVQLNNFTVLQDRLYMYI